MSSDVLSRDRVERALAGVEGWLEIDDAMWLVRHATRAASAAGAEPILLEIGSWKGRSTIALGLALQHAGRGRLFAVDPHCGEPTDPSDTMPEFMRNIEAAGVADRIEPIRAYSRDPVARFADRSIAFMFLDGSHDYDEVVRDIAAWEPKLAENAVIAFDDADWPGVNRALRERVARADSPFRRPRYLGKILYCDVKREHVTSPADTLTAARLDAFLRGLLVGRNITPHLHWRLKPATRAAIRAFLNVPLVDLPKRLAVFAVAPAGYVLDAVT